MTKPIYFLLLLLLFTHSNYAQQNQLDTLWQQANATHTYTIRYKALKNIANIYVTTKPDSAIYYAQIMLDIATKNKNVLDIGDAYWVLGNAYNVNNDLYKSIDSYEKALKIFKEVKENKSINILSALINCVLISTQEFEKVKINSLQNLKITRQQKDTSATIANIMALTQTFDVKDKLQQDTILLLINQGIDLCKKVPQGQYYYNEFLMLYFNLMLEKKDFSNTQLLQTLDSLAKSDDKKVSLQFLALYYTIMMSIENKQFTKTKSLISDFDKFLLHNDNGSYRKSYYELKYKYYGAIGDYKSAYLNFEAYDSANEASNNKENAIKINNLKSNYDLRFTQNEKDLIEKDNALQLKLIKRQKLFITILFLLVFLIAAISYIIFKIKLSIKEETLKRKQAESEMMALRSQVNPHFIQNTFDLMAQNIRKEGVEPAIEVIKEVSKYLRQVLNQSQKNINNIEDELEFTESYLSMQQRIYPNSLGYKITIANNVDTFGIMVPTMMLQPIVENCIKHGFKNKLTKGFIDININQSATTLIIAVKDNGCGVKINTINATSTGIAITQKRLALMFEPKLQAKLKLQLLNRQDGVEGAEFMIHIPLKNTTT